MTIKKRHHYVPKAHLKAFTNGQHRVLVYRKDEPNKVLRVNLPPENPLHVVCRGLAYIRRPVVWTV